ncbi:MAG: HNH endonuclease [Chloroflexi bacterium]|nr:HNH endonuclease [Chloroflexota bacterium]
MARSTDSALRNWLEVLAQSWEQPPQGVAIDIADDEIKNRFTAYPIVREALLESPFDIQRFATAVKQCWVMGGHFDAIRFNRFINTGSDASNSIRTLIQGFPREESAAIKRIDGFLEQAVVLGFSTPQKTSDRAGAAQMASVILTSLLPERFADYRRTRWVKLAAEFGYATPPPKATHGEWVVWAGKFASEIASTPTYQEYWPPTDPRLSIPSWVISGLCWGGLIPSRRSPDPPDPDSRSFPEGAEKRRLHLIRERNPALVAGAKTLGLRRDPLLRCQVCGFSFVERYGDLGRGFIEAHHTLPVAQLKKGSRTSVDDIALVCSNCHRMIHSGEKSLEIDELRQLYQM